MAGDPLLDHFRDAFYERITAMGFVRVMSQRYDVELTRHTTGWIGLNEAHRGQILEINPIVGIVDHRMETLAEELGYHRPGLPNTWMSVIGLLLPEPTYDPLLMGLPGDVEPEIDRLLVMLETYGLPELRRLTDSAALSEKLTALNSIPAPMRRWRAPLAAYLADDHEVAAARLDRELAIVGDRDDQDAVEYRAFAERLRARLRE